MLQPTQGEFKTFRYKGDHQEELGKYITISNNGKTITKKNVQEINTLFQTLLNSMTEIKKQTKDKLASSENLTQKPDNGITFLKIITDHLVKDTNNNFIPVTHSLVFNCYKNTLDKINNLQKDTDQKDKDQKLKITKLITAAFDGSHHDAETHKISGSTLNTVSYFRRSQSRNIDLNTKRWNNIPTNNKINKPNFHTVSNITTAYNNNTPPTHNAQTIQIYLDTCNDHQRSYNTKHNELIKLFKYLQIILIQITNLISIIKLISSITPINSKSTVANFLMKIPKKLLDTNDMQQMINVINPIISNIPPIQVGGYYNNMDVDGYQSGGGPTFIITVDKGVMNLEIADSEKQNFEKNQKINITQHGKRFIFKYDKVNADKGTLTKVEGTDTFDIDAFNILSLENQKLAINIIELGITDKNIAGIIHAITNSLISIVQNSITHATYTETLKYINDGNNAQNTIDFIAEHKDRIENILLRCYDLQALYLIKYFEIIALIKYIIYFCDIFIDCICVCNFIISLYEIIEIDIETIPTKINTKKIVKDLTLMLKDHDLIINKTTSISPIQGGELQKTAQQLPVTPKIIGYDREASDPDMGFGMFNGGSILTGGANANLVVKKKQQQQQPQPQPQPQVVVAAVVTAQTSNNIDTICSNIFHNNDKAKIHNLYVQLYNAIPELDKTEVNNLLPKNPTGKNFILKGNTLSNAELLYSYSILYDKYVIKYIIKNFDTHKTSEQHSDIKIKLNAIQKYFAEFDCNINAIGCKNRSMFDPDKIPNTNQKGETEIISMNTLLGGKPFYFKDFNTKINNSTYPTEYFEFYKLLFNAALAGVVDNTGKANYQEMIKYVEEYSNLQKGGSGNIPNVNVKEEVLSVIKQAQLADATKKAADEAAAKALEDAKALALAEKAKQQALQVVAEEAAAAAERVAAEAAERKLAADAEERKLAEEVAAERVAAEYRDAQRQAAQKAVAEAAEAEDARKLEELQKAAAADKIAAAAAAAEAENNPERNKEIFITKFNQNTNMALIQALNFAHTKLYNKDTEKYNEQDLIDILKYEEFKYNSRQKQIKPDEIKLLLTHASIIVVDIEEFKKKIDITEITQNGNAIILKLESFATINQEIVKHLQNNISSIYELIGGAAKTFIKLKPNTANPIEHIPQIGENKVSNYTIRDYYKKLNVHNQQGGYKYSDIINIKDKKTYKVEISNVCNKILSNTNNTEYGPFAGIFSQNYNNLDIYGHLFGVKTIAEHVSKTTEDVTVAVIKPPFNTDNTYNNESFDVINAHNDLTKTLSEGRNVVLFGYGFSGSGKTYTLVEGSKKKVGKPEQTTQIQIQPPQQQQQQQQQLQQNVPLAENLIYYDPSLLEQFINNNLASIESIEFLELYPLGHGDKGEVKIICGNNTTLDKDIHGVNTSSYILNPIYDTIKAPPPPVVDVKVVIAQSTFYNEIRDKITNINKERRSKLRILATPNNDDSSRGYLQITINLEFTDKDKKKKTSKLVFFDMPGSENTVRITQEFLGTGTFSEISTKTNTLQSEKILYTKTLYTNIFTDSRIQGITSADAKILLNICNIFRNQDSSKIFTSNYIYFKNITDNSNYINKNVLNTIFKNLIISIINYNKYSANNTLPFLQKFYITEQAIAICAEQLTLFFNKETCKSIFDVIPNKIIVFLKIENFTLIVDNFLKKVIFQPLPLTITKKKPTTLYFKYFKLTYYKKQTSPTAITDAEILSLLYKQITLIYDITYGKDTNSNEKTQPDNENTLYTVFSSTFFTDLFPNLTSQSITSGYYKFENYTVSDDTDTDSEKTPKHINVMILLFMYLLNNVIEKHNKSPTPIEFIYKILSIYVYKYVKFIIDQGSAIITTLEHLKYFFLSNINKIDDYNTKNKGNDNDTKIDDKNTKNKGNDNDKAMTLYKNNKPETDILTKERIYTILTKLTNLITLKERVNCGNMSDYKLLSILQKLKNETADLTKYKTKTSPIELNLQLSSTTTPTTKSPALFIMLAHIKCFSGDDEELNKLETTDTKLSNTLQKICTAEYDTLEFAQSISSTSQPVIAQHTQPVIAQQAQAAATKQAAATTQAAPALAKTTTTITQQAAAIQQVAQTQKAVAPVVASSSMSDPRQEAKKHKLSISTGGSITNSNPQQKKQKNIKKFDFSSLYKTQHSTNKYRSNTIKNHSNNTKKSIFNYKSKKNT